MSIEEEINAIIDNSFDYDPYIEYPHAELCAYVRLKIGKALDRIEAHRIDWKEIDGLDPTDAAYLAISQVMDEVQKIRKDLVHQPNN